jgi:hypothetical protein
MSFYCDWCGELVADTRGRATLIVDCERAYHENGAAVA